MNDHAPAQLISDGRLPAANVLRRPTWHTQFCRWAHTRVPGTESKTDRNCVRSEQQRAIVERLQFSSITESGPTLFTRFKVLAFRELEFFDDEVPKVVAFRDAVLEENPPLYLVKFI
jgi:hypothetical protein